MSVTSHFYRALDRLFGEGWSRKAEERLWYSVITWGLRRDELFFLNFGYEEEPPMAIPLAGADEQDRASIQLYHHVATQIDLRGKNVLEVSCGHGGGARYLMRALQPQRYIALDLNPAGIRFCREHHQIDGLSFVQGDAENLQFPSDTFDAVINIDASTCYPNFPQFLEEVARVLRPGGFFLYADKRRGKQAPEWERVLAAAPLKMVQMRKINPEVVRGLNLNSVRAQSLIIKHLPKFLHAMGREWAGVKGSETHFAANIGRHTYRSYCFEKAKPI